MRTWLGHRIVWYRVMNILEEHSRSILPDHQKSEGVGPDHSTKIWQVTDRNGMSCSLQTRRLELYFGQQVYESLWIAYW